MLKCEYCGKEIGLMAVRYTWIDKENNRAAHDKCLEEYKNKKLEKTKELDESIQKENKKMQKCPKCGRNFFSKDRFQIINYNGQEMLVCPVCSKKFKEIEGKKVGTSSPQESASDILSSYAQSNKTISEKIHDNKKPMSNCVLSNAYRILGLDINTGQKEILKRYKEISIRAKIEDFPCYDLDIGLQSNVRNEDTIKNALHLLQSPKTNIKEYFFWFQISDETDEKSLAFIKKSEFSNAIQIWKSASEAKSARSLFYKKNLTLLYCLLMAQENNLSYLRDSISLWHEIVNSDKFWTEFSKMYSISNELTTNSETIMEFKKNVVNNISEIYTDLYQQHNNPRFVQEFKDQFYTFKQTTDTRLQQPIYQAVDNQLEELKKIKITKDQDFTDKDIAGVKKIIDGIKSNLDKLSEIGSYDDPQSKVVRDRIAMELREESVLLFNHTDYLDDSLRLLTIAEYFCGTDTLKNKLKGELEQLKGYVQNAKEAQNLEIPGILSGGNASFRSRFVQFGDKKIFYRDVTGVSYNSVKNSVNLVPTSQSYNFIITSGTEKMSLSFSSTLLIGNKEKQELWYKLINLSKQLIEPMLVEKIVKRIFEKGDTVFIGNIGFDKHGFSHSYTKFLKGKQIDQVLWSDPIYKPQFSAGNVILFKDDGHGHGRPFFSIPMSTENAVILPELIHDCMAYFSVNVNKFKW